MECIRELQATGASLRVWGSCVQGQVWSLACGWREGPGPQVSPAPSQTAPTSPVVQEVTAPHAAQVSVLPPLCLEGGHTWQVDAISFT